MKSLKEKSLSLGGDIELADISVKDSQRTARLYFWELLDKKKPHVGDHLLRLFNSENLAVEQEPSERFINYLTCFAASKLFYPEYSMVGWQGSELDLMRQETPLQLFSNYLLVKKEKIEEIKRSQKIQWEKEGATNLANSNEDLYNHALAELTGSWKTLLVDPDAQHLVEVLLDWSIRWHLRDDWCLEFALKVLAKYREVLKTEIFFPGSTLLDNTAFLAHKLRSGRLTKRAWSKALSRAFHTLYRHFDFELNGKAKKFTPPPFVFNGIVSEIRIFVKTTWIRQQTTVIAFKEKAEMQFWNAFSKQIQMNSNMFIGHTKKIGKLVSEFDSQLTDYIKEAELQFIKANEIEGAKFIKTPSKNEYHFDWLIEYQVPDQAGKLKVFEEVDNRKTASKAIARLCAFLDLKQRPGSKPGKKKGSKDSRRLH